jgi:hypothetical protein
MKASFGVKGIDVNCTAAVIALASHPRYRRKHWVVKDLADAVSVNVRCGENHTWVDLLPITVARGIVDGRSPHLIRTQRSTGGWKIKEAERVTYHIIRSLAYTDRLARITAGKLKYDPLTLFENSKSIYALEMRRDFLSRQLPGDKKLISRMRKDIFSTQNANGAWSDSVISCAGRVERLLALGVDPGDRRLQKSARWVLSMCQEEVRRESSQLGGFLVGHHMFTNPDRMVEFASAIEDAAGDSPCKSCCRHLALAQSSLGIRMLIQLGLSDDERVLAACENLVEIHKEYGGFCDTLIRRRLEAKRRAIRAKKA